MVLDGLDNNAVSRKYTLDTPRTPSRSPAATPRGEPRDTWGLALDTTRPAKRGGSRRDPRAVPAAACQGLAVNETATTNSPSYWFFYDANGNVVQLIKASDRSLAAHYEYDPYGNTITATGPYAAANPFRFSTKWHDTELPGNVLIYYGYRYYSPRLGRWMNRDPIEELGGLNLYAFLQNSAVNGIDPVGEACTIWFNCTLVKSTPQGNCDQACDYSCTETDRQDSMTGQTSCDDIPKPASTTITTTASGDWLCKLTKGILGKKGVCSGTTTTKHVLYETSAECRNCSRAACRAGCDAVKQVADEACGKLKGAAKWACKAAAAAAHATCIDGCNAYCQNP